ncbi:MAG TPA: hypothetical protein VMM13_20225, partial [Euzebya sp.]|nr:hypothetical protein [Euzebya sp.]
ALNATLRGQLRGDGSRVTAMLADQPALQGRTEALAAAVGGTVGRARTMVGGGSAPGVGLSSPVVVLDRADLAGLLRAHDPPVVARVQHATTIIDLRTVDPGDDEIIRRAVTGALDRTRPPDPRSHTDQATADPTDHTGDARTTA